VLRGTLAVGQWDFDDQEGQEEVEALRQTKDLIASKEERARAQEKGKRRLDEWDAALDRGKVSMTLKALCAVMADVIFVV
jgi:hypothetical protein